MIQWYRETNGDYMAVEGEHIPGQLTARVAAIEPRSMCTSAPTLSRAAPWSAST